MLRSTISALVSAAAGLGLVAASVSAPATVAFAADVEFAAFAGSADAGYAGDGGPAAQARLSNPNAVAAGPDGTIYLADTGNQVVRAIAPDGTIRTVAGTGPGHDVKDVTPVPVGASLPAKEVTFRAPTAVAVGRDNTVYIADSGAFRVLALSPQGRLSAFAGTGVARSGGDDGPAVSATIGAVKALAAGPDGTVYLGDLLSRRVRAVTPDGKIRTVMGSGEAAPVGGGDATKAGMENATSLAVDGRGDLWVTSTVLQRVSGGRVATATWAGDGRARWTVSGPKTLAVPKTAMFGTTAVAASGDTIYTLDGDGLRRLRPGGAVDMIAKRRGLSGPMAIDPSGAVYVADSSGNSVFVVHPPAPTGDGGDNGGAAGWRRWWPLVVALAAGVLVVAVIGATVRRRRRGRS